MHTGYSAQAGVFAPIWITKDAGLLERFELSLQSYFER